METIVQPLLQLKFNILDLILIFIILFYISEGIAIGFVQAMWDLISFALSFIFGLRFYSIVGKLLITTFALPQGYAYAIGFFVVAFVSELLIGVLGRKLFFTHKLFPAKRIEPVTINYAYLTTVNHVFGVLPALISSLILLSFLLTLLIAFPLSPMVKRTISESKISTFILARTQGFEKTLSSVFGGAIEETLTFLTVKPQSNETIHLNFTVKKGRIDAQAEEQMLRAVNRERSSVGLHPLVMDEKLRELARNYSKDMLARGYFSHNNPEGLSPFDRMAQAGIPYKSAGENLALAPNVDLAMQGLMNSPGHRANILSPDFYKIGIGVIDGGIYGEMFTQEFTN